MSRNALILEKNSGSQAAPLPAPRPAPTSGEFLELVRRLFRNHSVVAVIGAGSGSRSSEAVRGMAAELASGGKRVVMAQAAAVLQGPPFPAASMTVAMEYANVWSWPSQSTASPQLFPAPAMETTQAEWLDDLRREFDAVILDCPPCDHAPTIPEIAAMADAALLVIESGVTNKLQIRQDQRLLELRGVKLAGCVLMEKR